MMDKYPMPKEKEEESCQPVLKTKEKGEKDTKEIYPCDDNSNNQIPWWTKDGSLLGYA